MAKCVIAAATAVAETVHLTKFLQAILCSFLSSAHFSFCVCMCVYACILVLSLSIRVFFSNFGLRRFLFLKNFSSYRKQSLCLPPPQCLKFGDSQITPFPYHPIYLKSTKFQYHLWQIVLILIDILPLICVVSVMCLRVLSFTVCFVACLSCFATWPQQETPITLYLY